MKPIKHTSRINAGTAMGKEIYRTHDDFGTIIVTQRGNKRILSFDSSLEQSSIYLDKPYYLDHEYNQAMLLGLIFTDAKRFTLLGLGGGGLTHCLQHYFPQAWITVIELRQAVIDVAYQWFDLPVNSQLSVICADAQEYLIETAAASADIIFSDLYLAEGMSNLQIQQNFVKVCASVLTDSGCLVLNFHELPDLASPLMQFIQEQFRDIRACQVYQGNWILYCCKQSLNVSKSTLLQRSEKLAERVEMPIKFYFKQIISINEPMHD